MSRVAEGGEGQEDAYDDEQYYSDTFDEDGDEGTQQQQEQQQGKKRHVQASQAMPDISSYDYVLDASEVYRRQLQNVKNQLARLKLGMEERGSTGLGHSYTSLTGLQHLRGRIEVEQK